MYEAFYDNLQRYIGRKNIQIHSMETESFVLSIYTKIIKESQSLIE